MRQEIVDRDGLEFSVLRSCENEIIDRDLAEKWHKVPNAKVPARGAQHEKDGVKELLTSVGFASLSDLIPYADLLMMKADVDISFGQDRTLHKDLLKELHILVDKSRDPKSSYHYLARSDTVVDSDGTVWQVQINRRRRRSRESHDEPPSSRGAEAGTDAKHGVHGGDAAVDGTLTDSYGNDLMTALESVSRVATTKEVKRIKRATAARRRKGEDCGTDDELEAVGLSPRPPHTKAGLVGKGANGSGGRRVTPTADGKVIKKLLQCAAVDLALESDSEGCQWREPSSKSLREWMGIGDAYFAPSAAELHKYGYLVPVEGYLAPGDDGRPLLQAISIEDGMLETSSGYSQYEYVVNELETW